jgi:hypothetical protein
LWKLEENPPESDEEEKKNDEAPSLFKLTPSDCLIDLSKYGAFLMQCFENKLAELKIIYRGTDH